MQVNHMLAMEDRNFQKKTLIRLTVMLDLLMNILIMPVVVVYIGVIRPVFLLEMYTKIVV